jgi:adenylosuccinate synthase
VLGGIEKLKVCHSYQFGSEKIAYFPGNLNNLSKCVPIYDNLPGWKELPNKDWREIAIKGYDALPENLKAYLTYLENDCKTPVKIISIGPGREDTIMCD